VDRSVTVRRLEGLGKALEVGACWRAGESSALLDEFRRTMRLQSKRR